MARGKLAVVKADDGWETPPPYGVEEGSAFGWEDRLFYGFTENGKVFDYGDWAAREIEQMLRRDYKSRQIESVLSLPVMSAKRHLIGLKGDTGELDWLEGYWDADPWDGGCKTGLDQIIGNMTTAFAYKKAFFELVFREGYENKVTFEKVAFRPATTCRMMREPQTGAFEGFRQEAYYAGPNITQGMYPIEIPKKRAFVFLHGSRLDPLNGSSDLEVAHWCYKTKQKLLFLWFSFLEGVALPRTVVKANDPEIAKQIAAQVARMRGSAVIPVGTNGNANSVDITTLDSSGKGASQFSEAINWLDVAATQSVLAGFLDLTGMAAARGVGSFALSQDASNYFLQFEEAKLREIERQIRRDLFAPLTHYNFGHGAKVPKLKFEPLNAEDKSQQIGMLTALMQAKGAPSVPDEFVALLAQQVSGYFGMVDPTMIHDQFVQQGKIAQQQAAAASAAGAAPMGQAVAQVAGATDAAAQMLHPTPDGPKLAMPKELQSINWNALG